MVMLPLAYYAHRCEEKAAAFDQHVLAFRPKLQQGQKLPSGSIDDYPYAIFNESWPRNARHSISPPVHPLAESSSQRLQRLYTGLGYGPLAAAFDTIAVIALCLKKLPEPGTVLVEINPERTLQTLVLGGLAFGLMHYYKAKEARASAASARAVDVSFSSWRWKGNEGGS